VLGEECRRAVCKEAMQAHTHMQSLQQLQLQQQQQQGAAVQGAQGVQGTEAVEAVEYEVAAAAGVAVHLAGAARHYLGAIEALTGRCPNYIKYVFFY
jgi:hypothetical protein